MSKFNWQTPSKNFQLIKKPTLRLTPSQKELYELVVKKIEKNKPILYEEAKNIYFTKSCRNMINGLPHYYTNYHHKDEKGEWVGGRKPYNEWMINTAVVDWLVRNLGILIIKGALKVIPQIELDAISSLPLPVRD